MKHDPKLAPLQPPLAHGVSSPGASMTRVIATVPPQDDAEARRLWALGLIATCSNQSVLFGEVPTEERIAAAQEVLRLSRLQPRVMK